MFEISVMVRFVFLLVQNEISKLSLLCLITKSGIIDKLNTNGGDYSSWQDHTLLFKIADFNQHFI